MNITRNNYENFFLLYADGELNAAEKQAVEDFVKLHPDLEEELDLLKEAVLDVPVNLMMPNKAALLKPELWEEATLTAEQEQLLLLIDNELPADAAEELKTKIASDSLLKKEWELLQQSKLESAAVTMPSKEALFRKETTREPIPIRMVRWMAAAAVVAGLGWFSLFLFSDHDLVTDPQVATTQDTGKPNTPAPGINSTLPAEVAANEPASVDKMPAEERQTANLPVENIAKQLTTRPGKRESNNAPITTKGQPQPVYALAYDNAPRIETVRQKNIVSNTTANIDLTEVDSPEITADIARQTAVQQTPAMQAVYNEDPFLEDEEYVNIAGARIKKQKLRSVFRGVSRTITRTLDQSHVAQVDVASLR